MSRSAVFAFVMVISGFTFAATKETPSGVSAYRDPAVSGREMMDIFESSRGRGELHSAHPKRRELTVYESRGPAYKVDLSSVPEVTAEELARLFTEGRDQKPLNDYQSRARRPTWLFPDDGCYARAELVVNQAERAGATVPVKVFVFGDLTAKTPNHPDGSVTWWYHVAPLVKVAGVAYVLDPAMEGRAPLSLQEWVERTQDPLAEVAVCGTHAYDPDSDCGSVSGSQGVRGLRDAMMFLDYEWNRVADLGRNPADELGDKPPWSRDSLLSALLH